MVNFRCQLDWIKEHLESWCICEGVSERDDCVSLSGLGGEDLSSVFVYVIQSAGGPGRTNTEGKLISFWELRQTFLLLPLTSELYVLQPWDSMSLHQQTPG